MRVDEVPMPAAVALRPRDERGYPVLAITPWEDGRPKFAATGTARTFICAVERRCSICGTSMEPGPVWRVIAAGEAQAIAEALAAGLEYRNSAATVEAPGHRACMLYAAVVCPYLATPTARRGQDATGVGLAASRGDRRELGGALAGFAEVEYRFTDVMLFRFAGLSEFRRHEYGTEQLGELCGAVEAERGAPALAAPPAYLLADEDAAERRFAEYLQSHPM